MLLYFYCLLSLCIFRYECYEGCKAKNEPTNQPNTIYQFLGPVSSSETWLQLLRNWNITNYNFESKYKKIQLNARQGKAKGPTSTTNARAYKQYLEPHLCSVWPSCHNKFDIVNHLWMWFETSICNVNGCIQLLSIVWRNMMNAIYSSKWQLTSCGLLFLLFIYRSINISFSVKKKK